MSGIGSHGASLEIARLTRGPRKRLFARRLGLILLGGMALMLFAPWQQSAVGTGRVIAYSPNERELEIQAPIKGRVLKWHFQEGDQVQRDDIIVELADNDPQVIQRYEFERDAVRRRIEAVDASIEALVGRVGSLEQVKRLTLDAADARIQMATSRARAAELKWEAAQAKQRAAELQVERMTALAGEGLESQRNQELAVRDVAEARAGTLEARANLEAARADRAAEQAARESSASDLDAQIASARDELQVARAKRAEAEATLAKVERDLARQRSLVVRAPRAGMLTQVQAREQSAFVKQGERIAVLIPDADRRAVALSVSGIDAPLIVAGQTVQLQFEGWPAIQLGGWPEAAVGTFTGEVAFVDAQATPTGRFRAVVVPTAESDWPASEVLRQGNRANGWVLLNRVTLGYELWRRLNGFPPDLPEEAARMTGFGVKKPKAAP